MKFHCQKVESTRNGKLHIWRLSGRFQTLIWRPGETVQNLESPGELTALQVCRQSKACVNQCFSADPPKATIFRLKIIKTLHDSASAMIFQAWCLLAPRHILKIEARPRVQIPYPPEDYYYQIPRREGKGVKCPGEYVLISLKRFGNDLLQ